MSFLQQRPAFVEARARPQERQPGIGEPSRQSDGRGRQRGQAYGHGLCRRRPEA
jgi:hypothetical protein